MVASQIFKYLMADDASLSCYLGEATINVNDIRRRLLLMTRAEKNRIPDHHIRVIVEEGFRNISSVSSLLCEGFRQIGADYLRLDGSRIHVQQQMQNEWQDVLTYVPPLITQAAFLHTERPIPDFNIRSIQSYFNEIILPNARHTALPYPKVPLLERFLLKRSGLHDLHIHLNGSLEVDQVWQHFLIAPDKIYDEMMRSVKNEKVLEQFEQESHLLNPAKFNKLLKAARRARVVFFDFIFDQWEGKYTTDHTATLVINCMAEISAEFSGNYSHPFRKLITADEDYSHLMAVEGLMYCLMFRYLEEEGNEPLAQLFHFYLLVLGLANRLLVQQIHQYGFEQFQKITLNGLREEAEKEYHERFFQMHGNELRNLGFLEGRFSPKKSDTESDLILNAIEKGWSRFKEVLPQGNPDLKLVAHFIKSADDHSDDYIRHKQLRKEIWNRAEILRILIKNQRKFRDLIVGIDAAASEFDTPPEVFSPVFRRLRRIGFRHFTYHAGEDFNHMLSGLRSIYEVVKFHRMQPGNRIGHATAAGLSPEKWQDALGSFLHLEQGEWLDTLVFIRHMRKQGLLGELKRTDIDIETEISSLCHRVYEDSYSADELETAWLTRELCPILLFAGSKKNAMTKTVFDEEEWAEVQSRSIAAPVRSILQWYHYKDGRARYRKFCKIATLGGFTTEDIEKIQRAVLSFLADKKIILETLPTSNVRIGHYEDYTSYHLWKWTEWKKAGFKMPEIVVGSDDTGIFATSIFNEYANIFCHLTRTGGSEAEARALKVINELETAAAKYRFSV